MTKMTDTVQSGSVAITTKDAVQGHTDEVEKVEKHGEENKQLDAIKENEKRQNEQNIELKKVDQKKQVDENTNMNKVESKMKDASVGEIIAENMKEKVNKVNKENVDDNHNDVDPKVKKNKQNRQKTRDSIKLEHNNIEMPPLKQEHGNISPRPPQQDQDNLAKPDTAQKYNNKNSRQKESSFIKEVKMEARKAEATMLSVAKPLPPPPKKKMKKSIFISYSPDAGFLERKFVVETTKQLKENNLSEDIWFDKDEKNTDSPIWFSLRMEAVERCRAAVLIISESYLNCPVSVYEAKTVLERQKADPNSITILTVLYSSSEDMEIPKAFTPLYSNIIDLTSQAIAKLSLAEKSSIAVGNLMETLDRIATMNVPPQPKTPEEEFTGDYKKKKICQWSNNDLQEWLFKLGIKEFYRQSLAEYMVDGFLLMSMTDQDMINHLQVDSRVVRKKVMQHILATLDKEHKLNDNWHLRSRTQRSRPNCVYLVYDPADVRLAQNLKQDLLKKGLQVIHHQKLGQSKDEFLSLNGPHMAAATYVLVLLTDATTGSPFVFHEVLFADWLGKKLVTAMFKNTWPTLRPVLKAILGECPSVDFETKMYTESMDVLEHHIKPLRSVAGVVLEQSYLNKMAEGLKPLGVLANANASSGSTYEWPNGEEEDAKVFISYQWDMQSRVEDIRHNLETNGYSCWADISPATLTRGHSSMSTRSVVSANATEAAIETLQSQIQRTMKTAIVVICCITPKYMQSDNCIKDLTLAETLKKPIIPLMLRFCPAWPPEGAPAQVRKILARHSSIDLSNDKLYKQNLSQVVERIKKATNPQK
ncbi:unnamed protein product [Owenia fusiformis]|uniref:Sterile alpha and TIR motif-containing protein 1 n=1 Tax=Owenia fusiformis TaxID=6347 RepID=A0A8S4N1B3_OWEFU|nr:unnamed protein product [Owenia fusiformis]